MDWLAAIEQEAIERGKAAAEQDADPVYQARIKAKKAEEFDRGVRLGWWDADGDPIAQDDDEPDLDDARDSDPFEAY